MTDSDKKRFCTHFLQRICKKAGVTHVKYLAGLPVEIYLQIENVLQMYAGTVTELTHNYRWDEFEKEEVLVCRVTFTTTHGGEQHRFIELYREQQRGSSTITCGARLSPSVPGLSVEQIATSKISIRIGSKIILVDDGVLKI